MRIKSIMYKSIFQLIYRELNALISTNIQKSSHYSAHSTTYLLLIISIISNIISSNILHDSASVAENNSCTGVRRTYTICYNVYLQLQHGAMHKQQ